jgi:hypothetical protein
MSPTRFLLLVVCGASLLGCNRAGPHFRDVAATRVTVEGSTFDVRVKQRLASAMRINAEYAPRLGPIEGRAALAMQAVSGCNVVQVLGDAALLTGVLDCGAGSPPLVVGRSYDCDLVEEYASEGLETLFREFDCYPVPFAY